MAGGVLAVSEGLRDEEHVAVAVSILAGIATTVGDYPGALSYRERAEAFYRRQHNEQDLPYTLANRADLLIRLGRFHDADQVLEELDAGIAKGLAAYVGRKRRSTFLHAFSAASNLKCDQTIRALERIAPEPARLDAATVIGPSLEAFCDARLSKSRPVTAPSAAGADPVDLAERAYWLAMAGLARNDGPGASGAATEGLAALGSLSNEEVRWRLAAVAAAAARVNSDTAATGRFQATARPLFAKVEQAFAAQARTYGERPDSASQDTGGTGRVSSLKEARCARHMPGVRTERHSRPVTYGGSARGFSWQRPWRSSACSWSRLAFRPAQPETSRPSV